MELNMVRGENSDSIPIDLIMEILLRLPAKSVARFSYVSKQWGSMLTRPYFTELFLTRSSTRPRLLFAVEGDDGGWCFFSSPQPQNPSYEKSSPVVAADFHMKLPGNKWLVFCGHASGLICFRRCVWKGMVICNPSTGQYAYAPLPKERSTSTVVEQQLLGFDPTDKQFKVLSLGFPVTGETVEPDQILTLGTGNDSWRNIHCPLSHFPLAEGICMDGVLYYLAKQNDDRLSTIYHPFMVVCFDVRSEKFFKFIYRYFFSDVHKKNAKLINYKGKLGVITLEEEYSLWDLVPGKQRERSRKLCMWVTKDAEKPESEWSEYNYTFCENSQVVGCNNDVHTLLLDRFVWSGNVSIVGVTATGEIVLLMNDESEPFYVFYLNLESNTLQIVEIRGGFEAAKHKQVRVFVDHICCNIYT